MLFFVNVCVLWSLVVTVLCKYLCALICCYCSLWMFVLLFFVNVCVLWSVVSVLQFKLRGSPIVGWEGSIFHTVAHTSELSPWQQHSAQQTCWIWFASDPNWLGNIGQKQAEWFLHSGLLPDRIHWSKTWYSQPEPNHIQAGCAQYGLGHLWKNTTKSESGKLVAGQLHSARTGPSDSCTPACFWTRPIWPKPDQAIQIRSGPILHSVVWAFFARMEPNWMQEVGSGIYMIQPNLAARWP